MRSFALGLYIFFIRPWKVFSIWALPVRGRHRALGGGQFRQFLFFLYWTFFVHISQIWVHMITFHCLLHQNNPKTQQYNGFYTLSALKSPKFVIFWNWSFFHLFSKHINFFGVISYFPGFFWEKKPKKGVWLLKYLNFMRLLSRISGENSIFWHIFLDFTLFHGIWVNSAPVFENSSNFAKI